MRKAVCKNNRQQVVLKKVVDLKALQVRIVAAVGSRLCVKQNWGERRRMFYTATLHG